MHKRFAELTSVQNHPSGGFPVSVLDAQGQFRALPLFGV